MMLKERLLSKLNENENACWVFQGATDELGYGRILVDGINKRAHRVSWEVHKGPIPKGMNVLHRCDNPPCCNPNHLFIGTLSDNSNDMYSKGRGTNRTGSNHPRTFLTENDVVNIQRLIAENKLTQTEIGELYGVSNSCISSIKLGKNWKHVEGDMP